jgi:cysteinyl-tRNA synthetase
MIKFFNTLGHKKQEFRPLKDKRVTMYVCGPTVYGPDHVGHIKTWIFFDWLKRFLISEGYKVKLVQNITDVGHMVGDVDRGEDKIEKEAKAESKTPKEIAEHYEKEHFQALDSLNFLKSDASPKATDYIKDIIKYIEVLIKKGHAYEKNGNVYFNVASFPNYGQLSGRKVDELIAGSRVAIDEHKKSPADFALWLKAENHIQKWPSPWGEGYPGWHIECSVMSEKLLGQPFDIHGSGIEHVFPHHTNEIAQSEAYADKPMAKYWLHVGMLSINGQKMSKSKGNCVSVRDALKEYDPDTIRLFFMASLWRKPLDWNKSALEEAKKLAVRLRRAKEEAQDVKTGYKTLIAEALSDDFNTPKALSIIIDDISKLSQDDFSYISEVFGLKLVDAIKLTKEQEKKLASREEARKNGDFKKADEIRQELEKAGIILEDTEGGTRILTK